MIRIFFMTLLAFVGPIVLMFLFRNIGTMLVWWLKQHAHERKQAKQDNIIDITPPPKIPERKPPPLWYVLISIVLAIVIAFSFWQQLQEAPSIHKNQHYVPAHNDVYGNIVPSHYTNEQKLKDSKE